MCKHKVSTSPRTRIFEDPRLRGIFDPTATPNNDPRGHGTPPGGDPRRGGEDPRTRGSDPRTAGLTADDVRSLTAGDPGIRRNAEASLLSERQLLDYLQARAPELAAALRTLHA